MPVSALRLRIQCYNYLTRLFKAQNSVHDKAFLPLFLNKSFFHLQRVFKSFSTLFLPIHCAFAQ